MICTVIRYKLQLSLRKLSKNNNKGTFLWMFPFSHLQYLSKELQFLEGTKEKKMIKPESTRPLSNFDFQWSKILFQNNLKHIAFFRTFFKG